LYPRTHISISSRSAQARASLSLHNAISISRAPLPGFIIISSVSTAILPLCRFAHPNDMYLRYTAARINQNNPKMEKTTMQPFLALITPVGTSGPVDPGFGVTPPVYPAHPIAPGGPPPGYWGGVAPPQPTHPIAPGGPPPGYWGGVAPPYPDQGLPGQPPGYWGGVAPPQVSHPIVLPPPPSSPGHPSHPIVIPPGEPGYPSHPIVLPPPTPGVPTHPIALPPEPPPGEVGVKPPPETGGWAYVAQWGWGYFPPQGDAGPK
jgi:hypothetical protein